MRQMYNTSIDIYSTRLNNNRVLYCSLIRMYLFNKENEREREKEADWNSKFTFDIHTLECRVLEQ